MAFTAKILSWRFRHLNIVGCLLKRRPTKGGSQAPQDPPQLRPWFYLSQLSSVLQSRMLLVQSPGSDQHLRSLHKKCSSTAAGFAQSVECWIAEQDIAALILRARPTLRVLNRHESVC